MSFDDDFYSWTVEQGKIIRERRFDEIDVENVAEEIESWGAHFKYKLADLVELLQTCLLLCWADKASEFTIHTREIVRIHVQGMLRDYPGLKSELPSILTKEWSGAVQYATWQTGLTSADFPEKCPWGIPELLMEFWYPEYTSEGKSANLLGQRPTLEVEKKNGESAGPGHAHANTTSHEEEIQQAIKEANAGDFASDAQLDAVVKKYAG